MTAERGFGAVLKDSVIVGNKVIPRGTLVVVRVSGKTYTCTVISGDFTGVVFYLTASVARKCLRMV